MQNVSPLPPRPRPRPRPRPHGYLTVLFLAKGLDKGVRGAW